MTWPFQFDDPALSRKLKAMSLASGVPMTQILRESVDLVFSLCEKSKIEKAYKKLEKGQL